MANKKTMPNKKTMSNKKSTPDKKTTTMADIARLAKVSKPTVSRALNNSPLINAETKKRVLAVAREHGYAANRNAQKLRQKRTNTIAVSLDFVSHRKNHIADPFIYQLLAGVSEALGERNQDLLLCAPSHNNIEAFRHIVSSKGADGFIFLGQGHREEMLDAICQLQAPIVVWGAGLGEKPYCVVGSDNFLGGLLVGRYFAGRKRRRWLFAGDTSFREIYWRRVGFKQAAAEAGGSIDIADLVLSDFSYDSAYDAALGLLDSTAVLPDAVFAFSDTAAMAFIRALQDRRLPVPEAVSVVGYNDIPAAAYFSPPVTTVRQDAYQAGKLLVAKLMQLLDNQSPASETIKTQLIVRAS